MNIIPRITSVGRFAGGELPAATGSGKLGTPCDRMHLENLSAAAYAAAVIFGAVCAPGIRCWQACRARWNDGDCGFPELGVSWRVPSALGSGKFATPWERMHAENLSACESATERDLAWWLVAEPHADTTAAQQTPNRTTRIRPGERMCADCVEGGQ